MKKLLVLIMALVMTLGCLAACGGSNDSATNDEATKDEAIAGPDTEKSEGVMTYAEYAAAALDSKVVIEAYVQGKQSWWDNKGTFYTQDADGAYFLYEMPCTEEEYNQLTVGTKIKVTGYKTEWSGEVEIIDSTFEILEGNWVAEATDVTALLGKDELINKQNMLVSFDDMTVVSIAYKNEEDNDYEGNYKNPVLHPSLSYLLECI